MRSSRLRSMLLGAVLSLAAGAAGAQDYSFVAAPQIDLNRIYRVNRVTGEVGACQYAIRDGSVGVTLCYRPGPGASGQPIGDYDLIASSHQREGGVFRVNRRTGEVSVCYVLDDQVVCTPPAQ